MKEKKTKKKPPKKMWIHCEKEFENSKWNYRLKNEAQKSVKNSDGKKKKNDEKVQLYEKMLRKKITKRENSPTRGSSKIFRGKFVLNKWVLTSTDQVLRSNFEK